MKFILYSGIFLLLILITIIDLTISLPVYKNSIWKGYYTVVVKTDLPLLDIINSIKKAEKSIKTIISDQTSQVCFNNFTTWESIPIADIDKRLDPLDPRLDPYMKKLKAYFNGEYNGENWKILYINTDLSPLLLYNTINPYFMGKGWQWELIELKQPGNRFINLILGIIFTILLVFLKRSFLYRLFTLAGFLPWILVLLQANIFDLLLFCVCYFYLVFWAHHFLIYLYNMIYYNWKEPETRPLLFKAICFLIILFYSLFLRFLNGLAFNGLILIIIALLIDSIIIALSVLFFKIGSRQKLKHRIFKPIRILSYLKPKWRGITNRKTLLTVICGLILILPLVLNLLQDKKNIAIPTPLTKEKTTDWDWQALKELYYYSNNSVLPNLAEYITHIAYQNGFIWGRAYGFPEQDEKIKITSYSVNSDTYQIIQDEKTIHSYNQTWLTQTLNSIPDNNLEKMLFMQGNPTLVSLEYPKFFQIYDSPIWTILSLWCIFVIPIFILNYHLSPRLLGIKISLLKKIQELA